MGGQEGDPPQGGGAGQEGGVAANSTPTGSSSTGSTMVKYGELIILGYNGNLPQGRKQFKNVSDGFYPGFNFNSTGNEPQKDILETKQKYRKSNVS